MTGEISADTKPKLRALLGIKSGNFSYLWLVTRSVLTEITRPKYREMGCGMKAVIAPREPARPSRYDGAKAIWSSVERTVAWLNRNRRLTKDFEVTIKDAET